MRVADLDTEEYLRRIHSEVSEVFGHSLDHHDSHPLTVYRSDRDDWILAMAAAGAGYGFEPAGSVVHEQVVVKPLVDPEIWREVSLVTVRGARILQRLGL